MTETEQKRGECSVNVSNSEEDRCFCNVALPFVCEQLKELYLG